MDFRNILVMASEQQGLNAVPVSARTGAGAGGPFPSRPLPSGGAEAPGAGPVTGGEGPPGGRAGAGQVPGPCWGGRRC